MIFLNRVLGIIKIENHIFKNIEKDGSAVFQGFVVALLTAIANALIAKKYFFSTTALNVPTSLLILMWLFLNLYVLSYIINFVGLKMFPEGKSGSKYKNLLRLIGYSYSPELLKFLPLFYPKLLQVVSFGTFFWVITCQILAVKMTFNFKSFWKSLGIVFLSYIFQIGFVFVFIILIYYLF